MGPLQVQQLRKRKQALWNERSGRGWDAHWQELSNYIHPRALRLYKSRRNQGTKQNQFIINGTATKASRILSSGMHAGNTPPSRPWFRLAPFDPESNNDAEARRYLNDVRDILLELYAKTNTYNALPRMYRHLGDFGVACQIIFESERDTFRHHVLSPGTYCLALDENFKPDTLYRTVQLSVRQIVRAFGDEKASTGIKDAQRNGRLDDTFEIINVIEPNEEANPMLYDRGGKPWRSVWFEMDDSSDDILLESGFNTKPFNAVRWEVEGEDAYANSPGMEALGDIKALQHMEKRKAQLIDKLVNPPMVGPAALRNEQASLRPGMVTYLDSQTGQKFEPAFTVDARGLQEIRADIQEKERLINSAYFADLFLMLANTAVPNMTAREIEERHEEKMLQLGPVLERISDELLDPMIDRTFDVAHRAGVLPDAPDSLQGQATKVEYISILAQAQKLVATVGIERFVGFIAQNAELFPDMIDKVDSDRVADHYADMTGVDPDIIRSDEEVEGIRAERQAQQQAAQMAEQSAAMPNIAGAMKTAGDTDLTNLAALNEQFAKTGGQEVEPESLEAV